MVLGNAKNVFSMGISISPFKCDVPKIIDQGDATVPANQIRETSVIWQQWQNLWLPDKSIAVRLFD